MVSISNPVPLRIIQCVLPSHHSKRKGQPQFGILDFLGTIEVTEPDQFLEALHRGFGRAKAFGCGLMLIRRLQ